MRRIGEGCWPPSLCSIFIEVFRDTWRRIGIDINAQDDRVLSNAECNDTARLNLTLSSAILIIILAMPTVDTVIRFDAMFNPFCEVILSIAEITLA